MPSPQSQTNPEIEVGIDRPLHFTVRQILSWVIATAITLSSLAFGAGAYSTEFSQMKRDITEGKEVAKELNHEIKLLREAIIQLNQEIKKSNVNK